MAFDLRNRHFLKLEDFTQQEILFLLERSSELKKAKYAGTEVQHLRGKAIALIFEKDSTRTRCAFEVAASDQGAFVTYLGPNGSHIGHKESIKDTARVLGRMYHAIAYRGFAQQEVEEFARYVGVPVWNGLTNESHPTQALADLLTMQEHSHKPLQEVSFCFLGDVGHNMGTTLMIAAAKLGMNLRLAGPQPFWPTQAVTEQAMAMAAQSGAHITLTEDVTQAVRDCDFLYTDVWVSMGSPSKLWSERIDLMLPYQVNSHIMALTHNPNVKFMHCLPSLHNTETQVGREIYEKYGIAALEVTEDIFESEASIVFDQVENRLHTIKAIMVATMGN